LEFQVSSSLSQLSMSVQRPLRLLTIGHSFVVALNRRLPHEIARISGGRWEVTVVAPKFVSAELRDITLEAGTNELCHVEQVDLHASGRLHVMLFGFRLRELLRQRWDMVHIYQEPYIFAGWQAAHWTPHQTPFTFFTNQNITKKYPPPFSWMEQYCLDRCAGWIGCGETVVQALLKKGYGRRPHRLIGYGVDIDAFRPDQARRQSARQQLGWDDSIPVIAFLGRLVPEKGLALLTQALDKLGSPWRLLFIGSGPGREGLEAWARKYPGRICFVSPVHDDVPQYLNAADILCAPSQTMSNWSEQFGRMITEGFASGLAVVGSDSGEIPHVIGDAGLVVGEKDSSGWVRTLDRLLEDEQLRADLSRRGRLRAVENFAWPVIARQHVDFFEQLLGS
jgi:glycosyltransferase involved in cell wall biosynthesis